MLDFLAIGHACHDTAPSGYIPGGAVTYAGLFAQRIGLETGILTSWGADYQFESLFANLHLRSLLSQQTTIFKNENFSGLRQQHLLARADNINPEHLPEEWKNAKTVFIAPIANEVSKDFLDGFQNSLLAINPQGWLRSWDKTGKVSQKKPEQLDWFAKAAITILSEEDVKYDQKIISQLRAICPCLVLTKGAAGCDLYTGKEQTSIPAFPAKVVDTTGAGDVFSAAFLAFYDESRDYLKAAQYANVAASFCVESKGIKGIPDRQAIDQRFLKYTS